MQTKHFHYDTLMHGKDLGEWFLFVFRGCGLLPLKQPRVECDQQCVCVGKFPFCQLNPTSESLKTLDAAIWVWINTY